MKRHRRIITLAAAGAVSAGLIMTAFGSQDTTQGSGEGATDVYAGVILENREARIRVQVPTVFAFVVNGTANEASQEPISEENGSLLLPGYRVRETGEAWPGHTVDREESSLYFANYSTAKADPAGEAREGIAVTVLGTLEQQEESPNGWTYVGEE